MIFEDKIKEKNFFYNWRNLNGYNAPIEIVIAPRGLGKTFGKLMEYLRDTMKGKRFVYICETREEVKTLSQNKGEKFFSGIKTYLENNKSKRSEKFYNYLFKGTSEIDTEDLEDFKNANVSGGTIKINNETVGYLLALNAYSELKRNNFDKVDNIIFDEFIPEEINITHMKAPKKFSSLIQSIARRRDVKITLLANSVRLDDILLVKLKCDNLRPGEIRKIKDKKGLLIVAHFVDKNDYEDYMSSLDASVSGRLSNLLNENNLNNNIFKNTIDKDLLLPEKLDNNYFMFKLKGKFNTLRIHKTKTNYLYVFNDFGKDNNVFCVDKKLMNEQVSYIKEIKNLLLDYLTQNRIRFESSVIYMYFKQILDLDINL